MMKQEDVRLQRICARRVGDDAPQQSTHGLEQQEAVALHRIHVILPQWLCDQRKLLGGELSKDEAERRGSHDEGRNSARARTNSGVASTCGQCPTGSSTSLACSRPASSREPAIGIGSNVPWMTRDAGRGMRDASSRSCGRRSYSPRLFHTASCVRAVTRNGVSLRASWKSRKYPATESSKARRWYAAGSRSRRPLARRSSRSRWISGADMRRGNFASNSPRDATAAARGGKRGGCLIGAAGTLRWLHPQSMHPEQ